MSPLTLDAIRICCEGAIPSNIATCSPDGVPNVAYLSQVEYVDPSHVALSFQFFNTTRRNVLANPQVEILVTHPYTAAMYRIRARYLRTECDGPLFERMKAKLAGIASHAGMSKVFRLQGSDVYRVISVDAVPGAALPRPLPRRNIVSGLRVCFQQIAACTQLDQLLDTSLACLESQFGMRHAMLLMLDEAGECLYTVASRGYPQSGIGSEIALGEGVIGVAARERTPIRIGHMAREYLYGIAMRQAFLAEHPDSLLETEIPLPGLAESHSQLAVPLVRGDRLLGVLYVESPEEQHFSFEDEDALVTLALQLALTIHNLVQATAHSDETVAPASMQRRVSGTPATIRRYEPDNSVFIDGDYLIKGVAGAIIWKLLSDYADHGRTEFSNRELRADPRIRLPYISDNLEARLILLQRRLAERCNFLGIEKTGRGRFRFTVARPIELTELSADRPH